MAIRLLFSILLCTSLSFHVFGQASQQDCLGAIPVCQEVMQIDSISNDYGNVSENDGSCLRFERNSTWFRVRTDGEGTLCFVIRPLRGTDNFDWAVYDLSRHHCSELKTRPQLLVACNASPGTACEGQTGASGLGNCPEQQAECIPVAGHREYAIRVQAPETASAGFEIDFSNSTATIVRPADDPYIKTDAICYGQSAYIQANPVEAGFVRWYDDRNGEPIFEGLNYNSFPLTGPTTYYLETQNSLGCRTQWFALELNPPARIVSGIVATDSILEYPAPVVGLSLGGNLQLRDVFWQLGDGETSRSFNPVYTYQYPGTYQVSAKGIDVNGCEFQYEKTLEVKPLRDLYVPSAFSPNGDGSNDYWSVMAYLTRGFQVRIYDRNGREIFQSNQPDFQWDGRDLAGKDVPIGNYTYYIAYVDFTGNRKQRGGGIMLIR